MNWPHFINGAGQMLLITVGATAALLLTSHYGAAAPPEFKAGEPIRAQELNDALTGLEDADEALNTRATSLEGRATSLEGRATVLESITPAGMISAYAASATAPPGWLPCDGRSVKQSDYPKLYAAIGSLYSQGNEVAGNFRVPDFRGYFLRGLDGTGVDKSESTRRAANGSVVGVRVGTFEVGSTARPAQPFLTDVIGDHTHNIGTCVNSGVVSGGVYAQLSPARTQWTRGTCAPGEEGPYGTGASTPAGAHGHWIASGGDAETRPLNAAVLWIIKT